MFLIVKTKIRRAKTVRHRGKLIQQTHGIGDTSSDHTSYTDPTQTNDDRFDPKKLVEVITGGQNTNSIFFQFGESLTDITSEKHLIACFGSNQQWQQNPMNHIYSLKLHFSLNLRWKFYVLSALFAKELITGIIVIKQQFHMHGNVYTQTMRAITLILLLKLTLLTYGCKFLLNASKKFQESKRIKVMNQQNLDLTGNSASAINAIGDFNDTQMQSGKLRRMFATTTNQTHVPFEADLPMEKFSKFANILCSVLLLAETSILFESHHSHHSEIQQYVFYFLHIHILSLKLKTSTCFCLDIVLCIGNVTV